jgi:hypothetical protein
MVTKKILTPADWKRIATTSDAQSDAALLRRPDDHCKCAATGAKKNGRSLGGKE